MALTNVATITQDQLQKLVGNTILTGSNLLVFGPAGIGKTEICEQEIKTAGFVPVYLNLSVLEAPDLLGLPVIDGLSTRYALPQYLPRRSEGAPRHVLLVDELDKGRPELQSACLELFQFRSINGTKLDFQAVLATGNLPDENAHSQIVSHPLTNRCGVYRVTHTFEAWQDWAREAGINALVVGFLSKNPGFLLQPAPEGDDTAYAHPSPRAWTSAARDLDKSPSKDGDFQQLLVAGRVGCAAAVKFRVWLDYYREIEPQITALISAGSAPPSSWSLDKVFVASLAGCEAINSKGSDPKTPAGDLNKMVENIFKWLAQLPSEVCVGAVKSSLSMKVITERKLTTVPIFMEVFKKINRAMKAS